LVEFQLTPVWPHQTLNFQRNLRIHQKGNL
jgi:hypothetical protein